MCEFAWIWIWKVGHRAQRRWQPLPSSGVFEDGSDGAHRPSVPFEERDAVGRCEGQGRLVQTGHLPHHPANDRRRADIGDPPADFGAVQIVCESSYLLLAEINQQTFRDDQGVLGITGRVCQERVATGRICEIDSHPRQLTARRFAGQQALFFVDDFG